MPVVVLPVLNEVQALPWVLSRMPDGYRPVVVDNGSTDGSGELAATFGASVVREARRGFGAACAAGLAAAGDQAPDDVVCFMDADGSLDPRDLPAVAGPVLADRADLVLGARQPRPGSWPVHARLANRFLMAEVRRRSSLTLRDLGPMRAAPARRLMGLGIADRRSGWPLEMVLCADRAGWRIAELPVPYRPRAGRSKVTGTVRGTMQAVNDMAALLR